MLHPGILPAPLSRPAVTGGEDAVAQDKEVLAFHAIVGRNALHGFLNSEDFRAVFQQNVSGLHGRFQHLPVIRAILWLHVFLGHASSLASAFACRRGIRRGSRVSSVYSPL